MVGDSLHIVFQTRLNFAVMRYYLGVCMLNITFKSTSVISWRAVIVRKMKQEYLEKTMDMS
jgi:hypothetical protein